MKYTKIDEKQNTTVSDKKGPDTTKSPDTTKKGLGLKTGVKAGATVRVCG